MTFGAAKSQVGEGGGASDLNVQLTSSREQVNMCRRSLTNSKLLMQKNWRMKYTNANFSCKKNCDVGNIIKQPAQAFNSAYIEF